MRIIFLGDVVGSIGIKSLAHFIPILRLKYDYDFLIVNGENATNDKGLSLEDYYNLIDLGIDAITLGNHFLKCSEIENILNTKDNIIRPSNILDAPGKGVTILTKNNFNLIIINLMTNLYMLNMHSNLFQETKNILEKYSINNDDISGIFIDVHGTSAYEKKALGFYCDGKVSAVIGTHTHVPTSDASILPKGTGYQTDTGMCGSYYTCAGGEVNDTLKFFSNEDTNNSNWFSEEDRKSIFGVFLELDNITKLTKYIEQIQLIENL